MQEVLTSGKRHAFIRWQNSSVPQKEEVEIIWPCEKAGQRLGHEEDITDDS